jgi:hypothetical protein
MFTDNAGIVVPRRLAKLAAARAAAAKRSDRVTYSLDLDIGEVADGYHVIVRRHLRDR